MIDLVVSFEWLALPVFIVWFILSDELGWWPLNR